MQQRYHHTTTGTYKIVVPLALVVLIVSATTHSGATSTWNTFFVSSLSFSSMHSLLSTSTKSITRSSLSSSLSLKRVNTRSISIFFKKKNYNNKCTMSSLKNAASTTSAGGDAIHQEDTIPTIKSTSFQSLANRIDNSWIRELSSETSKNLQLSLAGEGISTNDKTNNNKFRRQVFNGHYVLVQPTGIVNPELVLYSPDVAYNLLQLSTEQVHDPNFTKWVSGNLPNGIITDTSSSSNGSSSSQEVSSWATPYALSIVGTRYTSNCPYGTGNGYGDGRAISIAEIQVDTGKATTTDDSSNNDQQQQQQRMYDRYELQLKGSGKTPFCRGADGRAILRSSIREFLASEAMHYLRVPTTRALSLVVSKKETVMRPWYTDNTKLQLPDRADPRLQQFTIEQQKELVSQLREQNRADPNIMQAEPVAITCRVSPNFIRIGHFDLFARRVEQQVRKDSNTYDTTTIQYKELEQLIWHACEREYNTIAYQPYICTNDISTAATVLLQQSAIDISTMIGHWIRVGFVQGNFNADNNLISGRTMDYGPFGYVEEYNPIAAKWTGSGTHFGFFNQMSAGLHNYKILVESIVPIILATTDTSTNNNNDNLETRKETLIDTFMDTASELFQNTMDETLRIKLGFDRTTNTTKKNGGDDNDIVWKQLEPLLRSSRTDWTIFFRSLTYTIRDYPLPILSSSSLSVVETNDQYLYDQILASLEGTIVNSNNNNDDDTINNNDYPGSFYEPLTTKQRKEWIEWIGVWRNALIIQQSTQSTSRTSDDIYTSMKNNNPKYVLREWMLVNAYKQAQSPLWNFTEIQQLFTLLQNPYDEGTTQQIQQYYTRASDDVLALGGTAFMSCSS